MKKLRMIAPIALLVFASACNDDDGGSGGLTDDQQAAVDQLQTASDEEGIVFDEDCLTDKAGELSDEDAAAIVAAGPDGDAQLSAEGEALTLELFSCLDNDAMIDLLISEMEASGEAVDEGCVRDALDGVDLGAMFAASEGGGDLEEDPDAAAAMLSLVACMGAG